MKNSYLNNKSLFKYKCVSKNNIECLLKNELYISCITCMNDPCECNIYIDIEKAKIKLNILDNNEICRWKNIFEKIVKGCIYCASFCKDGNNEHLWEAYAGNYEGFAIEYNIDDFANALKNAGIGFCDDYIQYVNDNSIDFTDSFIKSIKIDNFSDYTSANWFFSKNKKWEGEHEYRIVINTPFEKDIIYNGENKGILIKNIKPTCIIVGYKINAENLKVINEYCKNNNVLLKMHSKNKTYLYESND